MAKKAGRFAEWLRDAHAAEAVRLARAMEAGAVRSYTQLAKVAGSAVTRAKFRYMAEEERAHRRFLDRIAQGLPKGKPVDAKGLTEVVETPDGDDIVEAVKASVRNEERAEQFYLAAARKCKGGAARQLFRTLANMEAQHARMLRDELKSLQGQWGWSSLEGTVLEEESFWG